MPIRDPLAFLLPPTLGAPLRKQRRNVLYGSGTALRPGPKQCPHTSDLRSRPYRFLHFMYSPPTSAMAGALRGA
jgi:hypothetical protein